MAAATKGNSKGSGKAPGKLVMPIISEKDFRRAIWNMCPVRQSKRNAHNKVRFLPDAVVTVFIDSGFFKFSCLRESQVTFSKQWYRTEKEASEAARIMYESLPP
jgi:hypothetical protein